MKRYRMYREDMKKVRNSLQNSSSFFRKPIENQEFSESDFVSKEEEEYIQNYIHGTDERVGGGYESSSSLLKKNVKKRHKRYSIKNIILLIFTICCACIGVFAWRIHNALGTKPSVSAEFFGGKVSENGAHNILILGTDQRDQQGTGAARADSIMVLQMDGPDKKVKMVSFMRDVLVDIPNVGTAGYTDCKLNAAYGIGEQGSELENDKNQGAELVRETLKHNFGVECKYYVTVNFISFVKAIDTLFPEGVPIDAKFGTLQGKHVREVPVPDDLATSQNKVSSDIEMSAEQASKYGYDDPAIYQIIKEGKQKMNGRMLLNYARFRHDDENDSGRVRRQQQVMKFFTSQVTSLQTVLKTPEAIRSVLKVTSTNVERNFLYRVLFAAFTGNKDGKAVERLSVPVMDDHKTCGVGYDMYGGSGIEIDRNFYKNKVNNFLK
ncbi:MAG: LCP family protein [Lactobacillales bacterium]|nr:LCP family protein [Lactobacillales bacterium]